MTQDEGRVSRLDSTDAGFDSVLARLRALSPEEKAVVRQAAEDAMDGHAAYAEGLEHLYEALPLLQKAADDAVPGAQRLLDRIADREELVEEAQETESEPYVRLAALRQLHQVMADMNKARSLADTLQAVADGVVNVLGYEVACVNLVRPDGDLVVAAFSGGPAAEALITGRVGSRESWERRLSMGEQWGDLVFIPHTEGRILDDDVPQWYTDRPAPRFENQWHPSDRLFAPMYTPGVQGGARGELIGVLSVDRPRNGRLPGAWGREALQMYAFQAAIAISSARLRAGMQRALARSEREEQARGATEGDFWQDYEHAPFRRGHR